MADLFLIPYVRSVWRLLRSRLGSSGRMCIFGAGAHTRWLLAMTDDLPGPPIECILDDHPSEDSLGDIPIRRPEDVSPHSFDLLLISSDRWEEELATRARQLWGDNVEVCRLYEGLPRGPYDKSDDRMEALRRVRLLSPHRLHNERQVVIVSDRPQSREAKIGYALRHAGYEPVLLHRQPPAFDASRCFESLHAYSNPWDGLRLACDYSPLAFHVMVNSDYRLAELLVRHRPGVIVVDSYDLVAGMHTEELLAAQPDYREETDPERFCLQSADGVCTRSRETDVLQRKLGYTFRRLLQFPDGCWNNAPVTHGTPDGDLTIVYAGKVHLGTAVREEFASCGCNLTFARALVSQKIHFHVFPSPPQAQGSFEDSFKGYRALERTSPYFHVHKPLPADDLIEQLSHYDLAISIYPELICPTGTPSCFTNDKMEHCTSNKFYDYIDAGLPIVHNAAPDSHLASILAPHAIGIDAGRWPIDQWAVRLRALDLNALRSRVLLAREDYDVRRHVDQLIDFYNSLRADTAARPTRDTTISRGSRNAASPDECRQAVV